MKDGTLTFDEKAEKAYPQIKSVSHVHTAGNSSGIVDGAGAVLLASPDYAKAHGWKPRARILATATCGAEPVIMLTAPVPATERCLKKAKMTIGDRRSRRDQRSLRIGPAQSHAGSPHPARLG
jgi:acetyl-CoA C-acetyltransferase